MPSRRILGLPSEARISAARAITAGVRASSSSPRKSTEIGTALARTVRLVEGSSPGGVNVTVSALVVMLSSRRQTRRKFSASAVRWNPRKSAPSRPSISGHRYDGLGEAIVDPPVGVPPVAVKGRRDDHVMEDRPERVIAETLVVLLDLGGRQTHRVQIHPLF